MSIFAKPRPAVKPTRVAPKTAAPFAEGVLRPEIAIPVRLETCRHGEEEIAILERASSIAERYVVMVSAPSQPTRRHPFVRLADAKEFIADYTRPRAANRLDHTFDDEAWWATNRFALPPICGGSPEPECGVSGAWSMPGELDAWLDDGCPDAPELSDDHNGAFGMFGCDPE